MKRTPAYKYLLLQTIMLTVLAVATLLPSATSAANALGYGSLCPFAPWSTFLLAAMAGATCVTRSSMAKRQRAAALEREIAARRG
ncbi:MAG: hypothetical protein HY901_09725 [Deltaproteobacteria bacterium]|nr:hypothetical protein [Deltaproteobacteria bacterium]